MTDRERFLKQVKSCVGIMQNSEGHKAIIDTYNRINPLPRNYKMTYTDPWCAGFVSACGQASGLTPDIIYPECSCYQMLRKYQKKDLWVEDDSYWPNAGDLIFYSWNDNGDGDCTAMPDHVGVIVRVDEITDNIYVVEGNYNRAVSLRTIPVNSRYIRGYATPIFRDIVEPEPDYENWELEREEAKEWAVKNGLIKGDGNEINWDADAKLWQVAMILRRLAP